MEGIHIDENPEPPEKVAEVVKKLIDNLSREGWPEKGICTHHGVSAVCGHDSISVSPNGSMTLVTVYRSTKLVAEGGQMYVGYTGAEHMERADAIADALGTSIRTSWNGEEGHSGISVVLSLPCPVSLKQAVRNYRALGRPFRLSKEERAGFDAFREWFEAGKTC